MKNNFKIKFLKLVILIIVFSVGSKIVFAVDTVDINLKVYSGDNVLFNGPKTVNACVESPTVGASVTVNGKCAIEQSGLSNNWTWVYSPFGWLDELDGYATTPDYSKFWSWYNDLNYGLVALNQHILSSGEELLLTYNSFPLRLFVSKISGMVGDTITFTAEEKSTFNADWSDMLWTPSLGVSVVLGSQSCTTTIDGTCSITLENTGSLQAIGEKTLYVPSNALNIKVASLQNNNDWGFVYQTPPLSIPKAVAYLKNVHEIYKFESDSDLYTDWATIAYSAANVLEDTHDLIFSNLQNYATPSPLLTDNERRMMVLLSIGEDPHSFFNVNYVKILLDAFDGVQFGDISLVNDDIFALIPLSSVGYTISDDIIIKDISFILSKQNKNNGSWEDSVDLTAAAIQALHPFVSVTEVNTAISNASTYLRNMQRENGGWESVYSTSWAMQAMNTLNVLWVRNGRNPIDYFNSQQDEDGAMLLSGVTLENKMWATSYAIPAVLGKPWATIFKKFPKIIEDKVSISDTDENITKTINKTNKKVVTRDISGDNNKTINTQPSPDTLMASVVKNDISPIDKSIFTKMVIFTGSVISGLIQNGIRLLFP